MIVAHAAVAAVLFVGAGSAQMSDGTSPYERSAPRAEVTVHGVAGSETIDVTARRVQIEALVRRIGRECNREVIGFEVLSRNPEITAMLMGENLRDALKFIGASKGLRITVTTSQITIEEDLAPYPTQADLFARAQTGYIRALVDHGDSTLAPGAAWNRARIEQATRGRELEAARAFDAITTDYPKSDMVPKALLEAGVMYGRANAWDEATTSFDTLAGFGEYHEYKAMARRLLADAHTHVAEAARNGLVREENARRALLVMDSLDKIYPTQEHQERRQRYLVRSRAHSLADQPVKALRALDLAADYSDQLPHQDPVIAELRARALERAGRHTDAVRAWLRYSAMVEGEAQVEALRRAAITANDGHEHLAAIAIAKRARDLGFGDEIAPYEDDAWIALDMSATRLDLFGDADTIERGERLVEKGLYEQAINSLRSVFDRRITLQRDERARLGKAYARALAAEDRIDQAMIVLRKTATENEVAAMRREIYLFAAALLEAAGEFDRAIDALGGRL